MIPQCIILQDESLLSPYGELKDNIIGNCYIKSYYGGLTKKSAELERIIGTYSYKDKQSKSIKTRPLMYASEIREMEDEILVLPSGKKPLKMSIKPAYKQRKLVSRMQMESTRENHPPIDYSIQYIDLSPYREQLED